MYIHIQEIEKSYGSLLLFEELSLKIPQGHKIGLVGDNGSGKSSLFKLITGEESPDKGLVIRKKNLVLGYLEQLPEVPGTTSVQEVIEADFKELIEIQQHLKELEKQMEQSVEGVIIEKYGVLQEKFIQLGGYELAYQIEKMASGLGIQQLLNKPFNQLSGGEQTKVGLVKVLLKEPDLLLLDEPTNHLDLHAIEWLEHYLKSYQGTLFTISHDRHFLDQVVTEIYDLEDGEIQVYQGNYTQYQKAKKARLLKEQQNYEEQQKKIKKLEDAIRRYRQWGNESGNEDMFKKAKSLEKRLARMTQLTRPVLEKKHIQLKLAVNQRSGKKVVTFSNVQKSYGAKQLFQQLNFQLQWAKHIGIVGENGVGKSTLIRLLLQEEQPDCGTIELGEQVKIGYLPQKIEFSDENKSVLETFRFYVAMEEGESRGFLAQFLFYGSDVFRLVKNLSGGQRMRLKLAILMKEETNLLILDEPTNHLDIATREVVEDVLADYTGTLLAISHDRYFLDKLFNEILWLTPTDITLFNGNYQWAKKKKEEQATLLEKQDISERENGKKLSKVKTGKTAKAPTLTDIENSLQNQAKIVTELDEKLAHETNLEQLYKWSQERDEVLLKVKQLEDKWIELADE